MAFSKNHREAGTKLEAAILRVSTNRLLGWLAIHNEICELNMADMFSAGVRTPNWLKAT
jgi:hypothetical protein